MITDIRIESGNVPVPNCDWAEVQKRWVSLTTAKLNGGFVFAQETLSVDRLFAEAAANEEVRIVEMPDGRAGVLAGQTAVARAMLQGKTGIEARVYRL